MRTPTHSLASCPEFKAIQPYRLKNNKTVLALALALVAERTKNDLLRADKEGFDTQDPVGTLFR